MQQHHTKTLNIKLLQAGTALAVLFAMPAFAINGHSHDGHDHSAHEHKEGMHFFGHIDGLIHADSHYKAPDDEDITETYAHIDAHVGVAVTDKLSIQSVVKLEGESAFGAHNHDDGPAPTDDLYFDEHPIIVEQLNISYDADNFALYAGKFNPVVSLDYHAVQQTLGIWTYQTLEGYAIRERIGVGGAYKFKGGDYGNHRLDVSSFFADTTFLSGSLLFNRGDTQEDDGGVSNTESFESFAVSLGGNDFYSLNVDFVEDVFYRFGFAKQAAGEDNDDDETRFSATLGYNPQLTKNISAKAFAEYVDIQHLEGEGDHDRAYLTTAAGLYYGGWNTAISYTGVMNDADEQDEDQNGHIFQVSGGYRLKDGVFKGLGVDLGWKTQEEEGEQRDTLGGAISYAIAF